jgi:hypothetical protein
MRPAKKIEKNFSPSENSTLFSYLGGLRSDFFKHNNDPSLVPNHMPRVKNKIIRRARAPPRARACAPPRGHAGSAQLASKIAS